jgi:hypothetical protein
MNGEVTLQVVAWASRRPPRRLAESPINAGETPGAAGEPPAPLPERSRGDNGAWLVADGAPRLATPDHPPSSTIYLRSTGRSR